MNETEFAEWTVLYSAEIDDEPDYTQSNADPNGDWEWWDGDWFFNA